MIISNRNIGLISAMLASGMLVRDNGLSDTAPAQTNAVDPEAAKEQPESRQVRRHRLRMAGKRHVKLAGHIGQRSRSKYMPHESVKRGGTGPVFA